MTSWQSKHATSSITETTWTPQSFPNLLLRLREDRGLSKAELAKRAALDPSSVTRFEQGQRAPERSTILQLADAMTLPIADREELLAAAGFRSEYGGEPWVLELSRILNDPELPADAKREIHTLINVAIAHGKRAMEVGRHVGS